MTKISHDLRLGASENDFLAPLLKTSKKEARPRCNGTQSSGNPEKVKPTLNKNR